MGNKSEEEIQTGHNEKIMNAADFLEDGLGKGQLEILT